MTAQQTLLFILAIVLANQSAKYAFKRVHGAYRALVAYSCVHFVTLMVGFTLPEAFLLKKNLLITTPFTALLTLISLTIHIICKIMVSNSAKKKPDHTS